MEGEGIFKSKPLPLDLRYIADISLEEVQVPSVKFEFLDLGEKDISGQRL